MAEEARTESAPKRETASALTSNGAGGPEKLVPSFRLEQESERAREAEATRDAALKELEGMRSEFQRLQTAYSSGRETHTADMHLLERGFKHESVRRFFRKEYKESISELPAEKRPDFATWLEANQEDPLYRVHFQGLDTTAPASQEQKPAASPMQDDNLVKALRAVLNGNPDSGTSQPAENTEQEWTAEAIRKVRAKNNGTLGDAKEKILAQWRAQKIIK